MGHPTHQGNVSDGIALKNVDTVTRPVGLPRKRPTAVATGFIGPDNDKYPLRITSGNSLD